MAHPTGPPPNAAPRTLARPRLIRRINTALRGGPVLLIAPAGYGKSHLLRAVLLQQPNAQQVQLSIEDTDVAQLRTRLEPLLIEGATVLLDDIHHLHGATEALAWLNKQLASPTQQFMLSGRMSPDANWLKRFALFDADQLAFSSVEANTLLTGSHGLTEDMIAQWHARTRGWPLLLSLLARQLAGLGDASQARLLRAAGQANDDDFLSYLAERMIRLLPHELFAFMQAIALPLRFKDDLAAEMLDVSVSQALAWRSELQRRNLFIEPTQPDGWFKVHDFVREFLLARAKRQLPAKFQDYFERITHWFEAHDDPPNAMIKRGLESALNTLENAPPPTLHITLMGDFAVTRGANAIKPADWERPIARMLFQHFVLHAGKKLTRDQIIEDLWPQAEPEAARGTLKTTLSRMRKAIEPYLRPKSPARYFSVEGEAYRFGLEYVRIDTVKFEQTVRAVLNEAERHDVLPVSDDLIAHLLSYQPILPELQYQAWTIAPRERLLDAYVKGCAYVAHARLDVGESAEAAQWAERAIAAAPWSEESYQSLMRAQSRQGDRALALRTHVACLTALKRELGVPPSPLSEWLAQRLRAGEAI